MYNKKLLSKIDLGKFTKSDPYKDDIIYDPMGQWKYPGQNTRIPSSNITMKGVNKPLLGVASTGEKKMMQPNQDYNFPGANYVDEFPQAKEGMIVDLTPAQIEEYRKGGYIVEELDAYAEGGRSSSCPEGMVWSKKDKKCIKLLFNSNTLTNIKNRLNRLNSTPLTTLSDGLKIKPLNSFSDFGKEKPIPVREDSFIETLETDVNDFLGKPLVRAAQIADNLAEKGEDPSDPLRHSTAGALTAQTIANKTGNIPFISNPLGYLGSNIAGIGHELSTLYNTDLDDRPWSVKLQESLEDIYNNSVGASTIFNNKSEKDKINYLLHLTRTNQLPDGYGEERPFKNNPKWTDPYNKKQYGGALNNFAEGGASGCPRGFHWNGTKCVRDTNTFRQATRFFRSNQYLYKKPVKPVVIKQTSPPVEKEPIEEEIDLRLPPLKPGLLPQQNYELQGTYEEDQVPEYSPSYPENRIGYDKYNWNSGKQVGMGTKWTLPKRQSNTGGFNNKMSKKVEDIKNYMEGYEDEEGNYIPGEIEKAEQEGRQLQFKGNSSVADKKAQKNYNKEYNEYENLKNYQNGIMNLMQYKINKKQFGGLNKSVGGGEPCPDGMIFNEVTKDCITADEHQKFLVDWYENRKMPDPLDQENFQKVQPEILSRVNNFPPYILSEDLDESTAGYYDDEEKIIALNKFLPKVMQEGTKTHENNHYLTSGAKTIKNFAGPHGYIVEQNIRKPKEINTGNPEWDKNLKNNYEDIVLPDEIQSRLMTFRKLAGFKPDQVITEKDVEDYFKNAGGKLDPDIQDIKQVTKDTKAVVNLLNGIVSTPVKSKDLQYAQIGGGLHKFVGGGEPCPEGFQEDPVTGDCVVITERTQDIQEVSTNQYSPYIAAYEEAHPRDQFVYQKKADYLKRNKNLNRMAGLSQDNFNTDVEGNFNRNWEYDRNSAVIEQFAKDHGINPKNHVEIVEKMADKGRVSYDMIAHSKYGSKLQPSMWTRSLAGAQELGNAAVKGVRGILTGKTGKDVFNKEIKGLTKKENKEIHESNFGALESLAWMDHPGLIIGNALSGASLASGGGYGDKDKPGFFSGEFTSDMDPLKAAVLNPALYADLGIGLASAGMTGLRVGTKAASTLSKVDDIVDIANTVRKVDNATPLLAKVDNVLPLAKVDNARSVKIANKKVPEIINKTDNVVPKKPQGVQQEFAFPKDTPLPKPITKVDELLDVEKNTARAENEIKIMEGMNNAAPPVNATAPVGVTPSIPPGIAAPKPFPNKVGNPDFFKQVLDQSPNLSASNRKFYEDVINTVKKQGNVASDAQMELLERIRNGNHNYSGRFGNINSGVSPELVTGLTGETNPLFARIANTYSTWVVDPLGGIFNKALTKASPLNAVPQYGNKVVGNVVEIGDILATGVKEGKLVVPKGIGKKGVQGVKKLFGKTDDVVDPLLIKKDKTSGSLYKAGLEPSAAGTDVKIAADAEKQGLIGRKFGKSNKEFKVTNKKDVPLSEIPLEDPGLTIYRRLPFSNKYIVIDKAKLAAGKAQWATTGGSAQKFAEAYGKGLLITGATGAVLWADAPSEKEVKEAKDKVDNIKKENDKILSDTFDENKKVQFKEKTVTTLADGLNKGVPLEQVINDLMTREKDPVSSEMLIEIFVDNGYSKEEAEDIVNSKIRENSQFKKGGIVLNIDKNKIGHWIQQGYHVEEVDDDE